MSNSVLNAVLARSKAKGIARMVLFVIADRADDSGRVWCGAADIAARANIERKNVFRVLKGLVAAGELAVEVRGGPYSCNVYQIQPAVLERTPQSEAASPRRSDTLTVTSVCPQGEAHTPLNPTGTPQKVHPAPFGKSQTQIPEPLRDLPAFPEEWASFRAHRRGMKKPMSPRAEEILLAKLAQNPPWAIGALLLCQEMGWQSFQWDWESVKQHCARHALPPVASSPGIDRGALDPEAFAAYLAVEFPRQTSHWTLENAPDRVLRKFSEYPTAHQALAAVP